MELQTASRRRNTWISISIHVITCDVIITRIKRGMEGCGGGRGRPLTCSRCKTYREHMSTTPMAAPTGCHATITLSGIRVVFIGLI